MTSPQFVAKVLGKVDEEHHWSIMIVEEAIGQVTVICNPLDRIIVRLAFHSFVWQQILLPYI